MPNIMINNLSVTKREENKSGTKEWADHNINCISGCYNNCRYCYAKMIAKRFRRATEESWQNMVIRKEDVTKDYRKFSGRVMFPSSHDIFDLPEIEETVLTILSKLLKNKNNVLIATKPRLNVIKYIDKSFSNYKKNIQFRFTITSKQDNLLRFWEPNAPKFQERMESLMLAFQKGYKTSVSIEPFLDYDPVELVKHVEPFTTESIWLGKMNYIPRKNISPLEKQYYTNVRKNYEIKHLWHLYFQLKDNPLIRFKDGIRTKLGIL